MAHPPELKARARELRKQGVYLTVIAKDLGVPVSTVARWTNPELENHGRTYARKKRFSQGRRCPNCKRRMVNNATLCLHCWKQENLANRHWPRERVIEAIQQWAVTHGYAPTYAEWSKSGRNNPALSSILRGPNPVFSSWSEALREAGFKPKVKRSKAEYRLGRKEKAAIRRQIREEKIKKALAKGEQK